MDEGKRAKGARQTRLAVAAVLTGAASGTFIVWVLVWAAGAGVLA